MNHGNNTKDDRPIENTPPAPSPFPGRMAAVSKTAVLAVDDDPQVLRVLLRILDPALYDVETAMTQEEALHLARTSSPAFVLLDLHLSYPPRADGLACLKALRQAGYTHPIFVLSADPSIDQAYEAARMGANGYLVKCDPERFLERLNKLLVQSVESAPSCSLSPSATAYFETRGLTHRDIALLKELTRTFGREKEIARALDRSDIEVQRQFQAIRDRLGARNQVDLGRILGVLSCFAPIDDRTC
jgi:DNA-binding NarL/FixJ family response regulator